MDGCYTREGLKENVKGTTSFSIPLIFPSLIDLSLLVGQDLNLSARAPFLFFSIFREVISKASLQWRIFSCSAVSFIRHVVNTWIDDASLS